jgi:hypothetical protein
MAWRRPMVALALLGASCALDWPEPVPSTCELVCTPGQHFTPTEAQANDAPCTADCQGFVFNRATNMSKAICCRESPCELCQRLPQSEGAANVMVDRECGGCP